MRNETISQYIYSHCVYDILVEMNAGLRYYNLCIREVLPDKLNGDIKRAECNEHCATCIHNLMNEKVKKT